MQFAASALDPFDRSNGNGSRSVSDDWLDETSPFTNEWGSAAATTFNPEDTDAKGEPIPPDKQRKLKNLYELHNGKGEPSRKGDIRQSYIENDAKTFTSVMEMPEIQRKRVLTILDEINISSNNFGGCRYEKIILAICSLVADESLSNQPNPSINDRLFLSDDFRDLMDSVQMSSSDLRHIRQRIRQESDQFSNTIE